MASRQILKSTVNWLEMYQKCPAHQIDQYRILKAKADNILTKVNGLPSSLPEIDWAYYKRMVPNAAIVADFEKKYSAIQAPMPKDKDNWKALIDEQEKYSMEISKRYTAALGSMKASAERQIKTADKVPPVDELCWELQKAYFPESVVNVNDPVDFPANEESRNFDNVINKRPGPFLRVEEH